jgi:hypothetical protein
MRRGRQFVTGRETNPQEVMPQATVVKSGLGIPRTEVEKPGKMGQNRAVKRARGSPFRGESVEKKV